MVNSFAPLEEIVQGAIDLFDYTRYLRDDPETYEDRKSNLEALISKAAEWSSEVEAPTLSSFLEELSLKSSSDDQPSEESVLMMTLHNGKGLEFTLAFIVGMEEDLLPHLNARDSLESLEEERRLCYVGMTRAKQFLYLTASRYRLMWGISKVMTPSRFLGEIPSEYLRDLSEKDEPLDLSDEDESVAIGTSLFHKDFGKGIVTRVYSTSLGVTYDVEFEEPNLTRSLVAKYAKFKLYS